jgi:hypothetical protein
MEGQRGLLPGDVPAPEPAPVPLDPAPDELLLPLVALPGERVSIPASLAPVPAPELVLPTPRPPLADGLALVPEPTRNWLRTMRTPGV